MLLQMGGSSGRGNEDPFDQRCVAVFDDLSNAPVSDPEDIAVRLVVGLAADGGGVSAGLDHNAVTFGEDEVCLAAIVCELRHERSQQPIERN
jgi:hypothetical protein